MRRWPPLLAAWIVWVAGGCGPAGDEPRAGWEVYAPPNGEYRVHYLSPPWRQDTPTSGTTLTLKVESNAERFVPDAALVVPPKYLLTVRVEEGAARARIDAERADREAAGETILAGPRSVTTAGGDAGWELFGEYVLEGIPRYRRIVFLDRPGGGVVSLRFEANPELDEPQIDQMVEGVEVEPET
ncbi:MAG: hypothetical protein ACODAU_05390 [Myxococcota bacterium]